MGEMSHTSSVASEPEWMRRQGPVEQTPTPGNARVKVFSFGAPRGTVFSFPQLS